MLLSSSKTIVQLVSLERLFQVGHVDLHRGSLLGITRPLPALYKRTAGEMQPEGFLFKLISVKKSDLI